MGVFDLSSLRDCKFHLKKCGIFRKSSLLNLKVYTFKDTAWMIRCRNKSYGNIIARIFKRMDQKPQLWLYDIGWKTKMCPSLRPHKPPSVALFAADSRVSLHKVVATLGGFCLSEGTLSYFQAPILGVKRLTPLRPRSSR